MSFKETPRFAYPPCGLQVSTNIIDPIGHRIFALSTSRILPPDMVFTPQSYLPSTYHLNP